MKKQTRLISMVLCAALVISLVLSASFIIAHADHDCTGDSCAVCQQLQLCEQTLKKGPLDILVFAGIVLAGIFYVLIALGEQDNRFDESLVSMKVKLSC